MQAGHVLVGGAGELVSMDATFCAIMQATQDQMRGRLVMDVTAPADRAECGVAIHALRETGRPFEIIKRFQRDDGSLIWVRNMVSLIVDDDRPSLIVATVQPVAPQAERGPAVLLNAARTQIAMRRSRAAVCDSKFFMDPGWDAILAIYVAEAEGRSLDVSGLAQLLDRSLDLTHRWVKALLCDDIIEIEYANLHAYAAKSYRLTASAIERLEQYLAHDHARSDYLSYYAKD